jgi:hypothetical protein
LVALFDRSDRHHKRALDFIERTRAQLVVNLPVVTEVMFLLRWSLAAQRSFFEWTESAIEVDLETPTDFKRIVALLEKYRDLPMDFADASVVALCERLGTDRVASIDSDFVVYRMSRNKAFRNVFLNS